LSVKRLAFSLRRHNPGKDPGYAVTSILSSMLARDIRSALLRAGPHASDISLLFRTPVCVRNVNTLKSDGASILRSAITRTREMAPWLGMQIGADRNGNQTGTLRQLALWVHCAFAATVMLFCRSF
jgi:hypothetical protein